MLDDSEVESFTRITNNDVNLENHYFQFVNKLDGVNYDAFNLGDDIEFTDDSYIGTYTASAENVPQKYINIAEQGYPLYYSLEKGEEWWESASATIYMDGAEKKLNVQVDFGKDREPLALNTMQELDPTLTLSTSAQKKIQTDGSSGDTNDCSVSGSPYPAWVSSDPQNMYMSHEGNVNGVCSLPVYQFDISSLPSGAVVSDVDVEYDITSTSSTGSLNGMDFFTSDEQIDESTGSDLMDQYNEMRANTQYVQVSVSTGTDLTADLGSQADTDVNNAISNGWYVVAVRSDPFDNHPSDSIGITLANFELILTYDIPKVLNAPTNLSATGTSVDQIDLSWTAPSPSGTGEYPAVSGYRIQSSDFAFANSSLPTGRTADADVYGAIDGGVDMDTANLYLSMNTTQNIPNSTTYSDDFTGSDSWTDSDSSKIGVNTSDDDLDFDMRRDNSNDASVYDLTSVSNDSWVLRFKINFSAISGGSGNGNDIWIGLSDKDQTAGQSTSQDFIGIDMNMDGTNVMRSATTNDATFPLGAGSSTVNWTPSTSTDYYVQIIRTSSTNFTIDIFTDSSYSTKAFDTLSSSASSSTQSLQYLKIANRIDSSGGRTITGTIDDVKFYNGVTSVNAHENVILDESYRGNVANMYNGDETGWTIIEDDLSSSSDWTQVGSTVTVVGKGVFE